MLWDFDLLVGYHSLKIIGEIICPVALKLWHESESQLAGPQPQSFWWCRCRVRWKLAFLYKVAGDADGTGPETTLWEPLLWRRSLQTFGQGPNNKYLGSAAHIISAAAIQLCHCSMKAARDDRWWMHVTVSVKLYHTKVVGWTWLAHTIGPPLLQSMAYSHHQPCPSS